MSIYPVRLAEWFPKVNRPRQDRDHYQTIMVLLKHMPCLEWCLKNVNFKNPELKEKIELEILDRESMADDLENNYGPDVYDTYGDLD
jgi:hypothetical protein